MLDPERVPSIVAGITLVAGVGLLAAPQLATGQLKLDDQDLPMRLVGVADLALVPGLAKASPKWPWMVGRCATSFAQAAYMHGVAPRAGNRGLAKGLAFTLTGLAVMDAVTALQLKSAGK